MPTDHPSTVLLCGPCFEACGYARFSALITHSTCARRGRLGTGFEVKELSALPEPPSTPSLVSDLTGAANGLSRKQRISRRTLGASDRPER